MQGQPWGGVGRWNGTVWSTIDSGAVSGVGELTLGGRGELFATGAFTIAGLAAQPDLARTSLPCPASAVPVGAGCASTAGPVALSAENLPWTGSTFRSSATGMTPLSLALQLVGVNGLALPLPFGAPGCSVLVDPIVSNVLLPAAGTASAPLPIPNAPSLAGITLRTQVVGLELDPALNLVRTTSTNALLVTVGVW